MNSVLDWVSGCGVAVSGCSLFLYIIARCCNHRCKQVDSALEVSDIRDLRALESSIPRLVVVTGKSWTDKPVQCRMTGEKAVISVYREEMKKTRRTASGAWVPDNDTLINDVQEAPWYLGPIYVFAQSSPVGKAGPKQVLDLGLKLKMEGGVRAEGLPLKLGGSRFEDAAEQSTLLGLTKHSVEYLMGHQNHGLHMTEKFLPVNATLTAVGELALAEMLGAGAGARTPGAARTSSGASVVLRRPSKGGPFYITDCSIQELRRKLAGNKRIFMWAGHVLMGAGLALIAVKVVRTMLLRRRMKRMMMEIRARQRTGREAQGAGGSGPAATSAAGGENGGTTASECVVCYANAINTVFPRCGHMCCCFDCGSQLRMCPICRVSGSVIPVYMS